MLELRLWHLTARFADILPTRVWHHDGIMGTEGEQEVDDAWADFKASGTVDTRNALIVNYSGLVPPIASRVHARLMGHVEHEDLVAYGMFGLMDAIEKFDHERGAKFKTYAQARIQGQMYDEIRKLSWVPRNVLSRSRDLERGREELEATLGRPATHAELATHLGLELVEYWRISDQSQVSVVPLVSEMVTSEFETFESSWNSAELDRGSNPEDAFEVNQISLLLSEAVASMDERLRTILVLYYFQGLTLNEIGRLLGVTGGRVCQLQGRAFAELQDVLSGTVAAA